MGEGSVGGYGSDYLFHQDTMDEELPENVGYFVDEQNNKMTVHGNHFPLDQYRKIIKGITEGVDKEVLKLYLKVFSTKDD